ncbi:MAG: YfhO family protein, partial [bacterium]|nr:YfhO family protein [bacterium]
MGIIKLLKTALPYLLITAAVLLFYPTIWIQNHTFISAGLVLTDLYLFNYPLKELMHQSLLQGQGIPLWTDLIGNGYPIFAEGQMGALYPLHYILFSLPFKTIDLFNFNILAHTIFAGVITYLYASKSIKLSQKASILSAIVYIFSGYVLTHLHQVNIILVIMYFPLNLLLVDYSLNSIIKVKKVIKLLLLISLSLYMQITIGHIEMAYYNILFTGFYLFFKLILDIKASKNINIKLSIFITSLLIAFGLSMTQVLSSYELVSFSQRETGLSYEHTTGTLWPLEKLILFVNPKAFPIYYADPTYRPDQTETVNIGALYPYIGIAPLLLSFFALGMLIKTFRSRQSIYINKATLIFATLTLFTYLYAVGRSTQLFAVIWGVVPGLKFFRYPVKGIYVIEFSLAILSAIGLDRLIDLVINKAKRANKSKSNINTQKSEILNTKNEVAVKRVYS